MLPVDRKQKPWADELLPEVLGGVFVLALGAFELWIALAIFGG